MSRAGELRLSKLETLQAEGYLDETDTEEVADALVLLAEKYSQGDITHNFAMTVIRKLADESRPKYLPRRCGEWGECVEVESEVVERG